MTALTRTARFLAPLLLFALPFAGCRLERTPEPDDRGKGGAAGGGMGGGLEPVGDACAKNERVASNVCVPCDPGMSNAAGDDVSGEDTECDDACSDVLGRSCDDFEEAYVKASLSGAGDAFGWSVALDGDTLAVGARLEDSNAASVNGHQANEAAPDSGAVYVFTRTDGLWSQQAYLKGSNLRDADRFGSAVALDGDTLAVGALGESSSAAGVNAPSWGTSLEESGAVYVFTRKDGKWTEQAYIKASNPDALDRFGASVAVSGDTLAVGAPHADGGEEDVSLLETGAVYVFTRMGTTWSQQAFLRASNADRKSAFGCSLGLDGDTLAVGAWGENGSATGVNGDEEGDPAGDSGAVYVFTRTGTTWSEQAYVKASNAKAGDEFGFSVALDGDTLAVGATGESSNATGVNGTADDESLWVSGAVYVFTRTGATWTEQAYVKASNTNEGDEFGYAVALDGDTLAVGALKEDSKSQGTSGDQKDNSAENSGAVYVYTRAGTTWTERAYVKASNTGKNDRFGQSVALDGDFLAVGAPREGSDARGVYGDGNNDDAPESGAVYVRRLAP